MNRKACQRIAAVVGRMLRGRATMSDIAAAIQAAPIPDYVQKKSPTGKMWTPGEDPVGGFWVAATIPGTWRYYADRFLAWLADPTGPLPHSIFTPRNIKVPWTQFSTLPVITCPGAGPCAVWCYSFKAWRYPAAFFRQLMNTILLCTPEGRARIAAAWNALKSGDVRLYVDGDFDSARTVEFWFALCIARPDLDVYGYSKSWALLTEYAGPWPRNYQLNGSSGSRYGDVDGPAAGPLAAALRALPVYRGEFRAVPRDTLPMVAAAIKADGGKAFVCPGSCGDCVPAGHACGLASFAGVTVLEGLH